MGFELPSKDTHGSQNPPPKVETFGKRDHPYAGWQVQNPKVEFRELDMKNRKHPGFPVH